MLTVIITICFLEKIKFLCENYSDIPSLPYSCSKVSFSEELFIIFGKL